MKALNDRVICKLCNMPDKTKGGILLPKQAFQDGEAKINIGRVISAGDGMMLRNGEIIPVKVKEGDVIVWEQFGALRMEILGPRTVCVRSEDIGAILDKTEYDDGWFEDFEGGEHAENLEKTFENRKKILAVGEIERENKCTCDVMCTKCGFEDQIKLDWIDKLTVDESGMPKCAKCFTNTMKITKKHMNIVGIIH